MKVFRTANSPIQKGNRIVCQSLVSQILNSQFFILDNIRALTSSARSWTMGRIRDDDIPFGRYGKMDGMYGCEEIIFKAVLVLLLESTTC